MAAQKKVNNSKEKSKSITLTKPGTEYVFQKFSPKALALINKYNLQTDDSYKKLISSFERIESLPKDDPRRPNLVELWEGEFNRIFKHFWENFSSVQRVSETGIAGWKDRLDVKPISMSPDQKRKDLMSRLSPNGISVNRTTKEQILTKAGYQQNIKTDQFNFTAMPKTGQNIFEIENILSSSDNKEFGEPESILSNNYAVSNGNKDINLSQEEINNIDQLVSNLEIDEETELMTSEPVRDPGLLEFVSDGKIVSSNEEQITNNENKELNSYSKEYIVNEKMKRDEFNRTNNIEINEEQLEEENYAFLELGTDFFQEYIGTEGLPAKEITKNGSLNFEYTKKDEEINPEKRNILSKEGFEININSEKTDLMGKPAYSVQNGKVGSKPFHEIHPIGYYPMNYEASKRPSMQDLMLSNKREGNSLDEMSQKIEFLRELRNERRHRINMMKIERANSYILARARRLAENRELRRIKRREDLNLKSIEKAERMRRLQERQKLIELMKERQLKRTEEKRVATVLRLERERRMERDAKYRSEIALIDSQIKHEQEMIKRTELKMKAYFTRVHDDQLFDESLKIAKDINEFKSLEEKANILKSIEEQKRADKIEKISRKFIKNIK
ncbi:hypothetical protein [Spiroplasma taiwanense]|uniref:Uncharacterized protein n=1 Tax=Spiroplasma taiwanense CT-1 TaxID=1276220 RepID=S5LZ77_9MOLU|nr:hypothetical protein [Spiroplasma taiwanense]AGR41007.1 hypothetical protein STAIW_v1c03490 [Spiroplasma taiwanense CT-1]